MKLTRYFTRDAIAKAVRESNPYKSRTALVWISPRTFLKLTPTLKMPDFSYYSDMLTAGSKLEQVPHLRTKPTGQDLKQFQVIGHEGRHRSLAILHKNIDGTIPVLLIDIETRWKEDRVAGPIELKAQQGTYTAEIVLNGE